MDLKKKEKAMNKAIPLSLLLVSFCAFGTQNFKVEDGSTIKVDISPQYLTRIMIKNGRISNVWGMDNSVTIKPDRKNGEIFIKPKSLIRKPFSFFVKDSLNNTYTLQASVSDHADQTIELVPKYNTSISEDSKFKSVPFVKRVKDIIRLMATNSTSDNCSVENIDKEVDLWEEVSFTHKKRYLSGKLTGNIFLLKNSTEKDLTLNENEFLNLKSNVKAVAIENHTLKKGEQTNVYIVTY